MPKKEQHVHKYKKIIFKSSHTIYKCTLPGCTSFINEYLLPGRFCICWNCGEPFIVKNTKLTKPHCDKPECNKHYKDKYSRIDKVETNIEGRVVDLDKLTELLT